jgi:drug/metabolite transporter (DMT)-like permease
VTAWGVSFVATRIALESFTPAGLVAIRHVVATAVLVALARRAGGPLLPASRDLRICVFLGLVLAAHHLVQAVGLRFTSAINAGWIIGFAPVPIALGARFYLKQRLTLPAWLGVAVATGGISLIVASTTPGFAGARTGDALQILSTLTWALYTLVGAGVVARNGALRVTVPATVVGAVLLSAASAGTGILHGALTARGLIAVAFLGLVCSGLGYYLWFRVLNEHGAARTGSYLYLEPFVTVAAASWILREPVTAPVIGGGILVLLGVWAVARGTRRAGERAAEPGARGPGANA